METWYRNSNYENNDNNSNDEKINHFYEEYFLTYPDKTITKKTPPQIIRTKTSNNKNHTKNRKNNK